MSLDPGTGNSIEPVFIRVAGPARIARTEKRLIYEGYCSACGTHFRSDRSFRRHVLDQHTTHPQPRSRDIRQLFQPIDAERNRQPTVSREPIQDPADAIIPLTLTSHEVQLVEAVARNGWSIASVESSEFRLFIRGISTKFKIPGEQKLRGLIIKFAQHIESVTKAALRTSLTSLVVDGGTIGQFQYYVIVGFTIKRLFMMGVVRAERTTADNLARLIAERVRHFDTTIICAVTDNARNLSGAFTETHAMLNNAVDGVVQNVPSLLGKQFPRIACGIHTAMLALHDLQGVCPVFAAHLRGIHELLALLRANKAKVREIDFTLGKIPRIQEIKWTSMFDAFEWVMFRRTKLLALRPEGRKQVEIPEQWEETRRVLSVVRGFVVRAQANLMTMSYFAFRFDRLLMDLGKQSIAGSLTATQLHRLLIERFRTTANIGLISLAKLLTQTGFELYCCERNKWALQMRDEPSESDIRDYTEFKNKAMNARNAFLEYAASVGIMVSDFDIIWQCFLSAPHGLLPYLDPVRCWQEMRFEKLHGVKLYSFAEVGLRIVSLPASEAVCERVFSHMEQLFDCQRLASAPDLIEAEICIRMDMLFRVGPNASDQWFQTEKDLQTILAGGEQEVEPDPSPPHEQTVVRRRGRKGEAVPYIR